ncbi:AbrB/MazE/SpoVT family DNA-binding domain-containing protein [Candidatus Parcubacteria bacterium]|nr:AbrB/MazE/SpoVT family DNA-binding domain-containing protein [Candidatus Parcubacteria bacterium]
MDKENEKGRAFYGTTTIGEKGQAVIPAGARDKLKLKAGDKLLVFSMGDMIAMSKVANLEKIANHLENRLKAIKTIIKKNEK